MSPLICFPNKLARPGSGVRGEFGFAESDLHGDAGKGVDFMGASCSLDPGSKAVGECGKRLSESSWVSEDLSCGAEIKRDMEASRGSPEWAGAADPQRAISLDASECLSEMSNLSGMSLVRSTALEDLTSIGDRNLCVPQGEELISEETNDGLTAEGAAPKPLGDSGSKNITSETPRAPHTQSALQSSSDSHCEDLSKKQRLFNKLPSDTAAENGGDSSLHTASYSKPDISNDSEMRSGVAQTTGTTELQKTPPQSTRARKSLVPVAVFKGLCAVMFTSSEPVLFSSLLPLLWFPTQLLLCVMQHSPSEVFLWTLTLTRGEACRPPSPHFSFFLSSLHLCSLCWLCSPKKKPPFCFMCFLACCIPNITHFTFHENAFWHAHGSKSLNLLHLGGYEKII